jgi:dephospho-CoA kinase
LDCDAIYHRLLQTDTSLLSAIETRFPGTVVSGALDRKALGTIVFSDEAALADLNRITHSAVKAEVLRQLEPQPKLAAIDAIGLFESGLASLCDVTVAITAPEAERIRRLMDRDGITEDYAKKRIAAQHTESWFRKKCDYTLQNDSTPAQFREKCLAFLHSLDIM